MSGKSKGDGALTAEEIFNLADRPIERVDFPKHIPGWGGRHLYVRSIGSDERDHYDLSFSDDKGKLKKDKRGIRSKLVALCACTKAGARLFSDGQAEALGTRCAAAMDVIYEKARKLNGMSDADVEELAGNSGAAPSGDSGTP